MCAFSITPKGQKQNGRAHLLNNGGVRGGWQKLAFKKKFLRTQHSAGRKSLIKILFSPVGFCFNSNIMSFPNPFRVGRQNFLTVILCSNLPFPGFVLFLFFSFSIFLFFARWAVYVYNVYINILVYRQSKISLTL